MITTCTTCGNLFEAGSEEQANDPNCVCRDCWRRAQDFRDAERYRKLRARLFQRLVGRQLNLTGRRLIYEITGVEWPDEAMFDSAIDAIGGGT